MNKKILAMAVVVATFAPAVQADAKFLGSLQAELASVNGSNELAGLAIGDPYYGGSGNRGRFGVKWTDGDVFGKIVFNVDVTTNQYTNSESRETYIGLNVGPGKFSVGNMSSGYKLTGGADIDPFHATGLQARGNGGSANATVGYILTARYAGKAGALKYIVDYLPAVVNKPSGDIQDTTGTASKARLGVSLAIDVGKFNLFFSSDSHRSTLATPQSATKFGVKMKTGDMNIAFQTEANLKNGSGNGLRLATGVFDAAGADTNDTLSLLSLSMPVGGMTFGTWLGVGDVTQTSFSIGIKKAMSKKASLYAGIISSNGGKKGAFIVGMRTGF